MFHFNFHLEDGVDGVDDASFTGPPIDDMHHEDVALTPQPVGDPFSEHDLDALLETIPPRISYSFISIPTNDDSQAPLTLARRDLFDARFQLLSEGEGDIDDDLDAFSRGPGPGLGSALRFIDAPSDLVPLVYEGGLKTWECSLDLARYVWEGYGVCASARVKSRRVLELGCGTAIPTLCFLAGLFSSVSAGQEIETHVHVQDYNASVLRLVTVPNIVLAWYTSPAAEAYRTCQTQQEGGVTEVEADSELHITPNLCQAFKSALRDYRLRLRFFSGAWDVFELARTGGRYDLVLTSETMYRSSSLPSLVRILRDACAGPCAHEQEQEERPVCLVAAKTVYFGVGGGIAEFVQCVESSSDAWGNRGQVETVWGTSTGVSRKVMRVWWT